MPWFLVDDDFPTHEGVLAVSLAARGLWATAGAWASKRQVDVVPAHVLASYGSTPKLVDELTTARMLKRVRGGYRIEQEGLCRIPTPEQVESSRRSKAARQARWRQKRDAHVDAHHRLHVDPVDNPNEKKPTDNPRSEWLNRQDVDASVDASTSASPLDPDPDQSVVDVVSSVADRYARVADEDLIQVIKTTIRNRTGVTVDDDWALKIANGLLNGHTAKNRAAYCRAAIEKERDPRTRFLPNGGRP